MNTTVLSQVEEKYYRTEVPSFNVGDTIKVHNVIREGEKSRVQIFQGVVISRKGSGLRAMFTVRKISDGIGVEKIFPLHSPNVEKIEVTKAGRVRRAKLYYLREREGKAALRVMGANVNKKVSEVKTKKSVTKTTKLGEKVKEVAEDTTA